MQWSKSYLPKDIADRKVMEFTPVKIDLGTPEAAKEYISKKHGHDFRMNDAVQVQTGVDKIEVKNNEDKVELLVLQRLEQIQTDAYQQAYDLGLNDGKKKAYEDQSEVIKSKLTEFEELLKSIEKMKSELAETNEAFLMKLLFEMTKKITYQVLDNLNEPLLELLRKVVDASQQDETIRVQLNNEQYSFIEDLKNQNQRQFEFLKRIKIEQNDVIRSGGCIIETNYGEIDSQVETRVTQLWSLISDLLPKSKDKVIST